MYESIVFLFGNSFLWGLKPLLEKQIVRKTNSIDMSLLRYVLGGLICLFLIVVFGRTQNFLNFGFSVYWNMAIIAFVGFLALFANYYLLSIYDANLVHAVVNALSIIVTMVLGYLFYNEKISMSRAIGITIISIGIFIVYYSK